jgi:hypothetical protein
MVSPLGAHTPSPAWRFACIGALASVPATALLNWLPNSGATVGGGAMIVGALIAGGIAATRSADSGAAGVRAGLLAGVVEILAFTVRVDPAAAWPLSRVVFWVFAGVFVLCVAPVFGLVFGRVGGWVATAVTAEPDPGANAS